MKDMKKSGRKRKSIICPYCGGTAVFRDGSFVYGEDSLVEKLYVCNHYPECNAYVGVFRNSDIPKGTLANGDLRNKRIQAHHAFDAIWKQGIMSRGQAYQWMQHKFSLTRAQAHIGYFSEYMCDELIRACQEVLQNHRAKGA